LQAPGGYWAGRNLNRRADRDAVFMEDYNADFLTMLETWEAALKFRAPAPQNSEPIEMAWILGRNRPESHKPLKSRPERRRSTQRAASPRHRARLNSGKTVGISSTNSKFNISVSD
jgi:hypothetical protein